MSKTCKQSEDQLNKTLLSTNHSASVNHLSTKFSTFPILSGKKEGWRIRAKLAVRGGIRSPKIGLFRPGTHEVEDLPYCSDHHPAIQETVDILRREEFIPYDEKNLKGQLRYIQCTVSRKTGEVQLVLVLNGKNEGKDWISGLIKKHKWHSIWINIQEGSTNTIFGKEWILVYGKKYLEDQLLDFPIFLHPACFIQAHLDLYQQILLDIKERVVWEGVITELYAGIGCISRSINHPSNLVEWSSFAKESFLKAKPPSYLNFYTGKSEEYTHLFQKVLIVDPPRKGLDPKILKAIKISGLKQILYLSCNPKTLYRDVEHLSLNKWYIKEQRGYELFPGTEHVEILMDLRKE